MLCRKLQTFVLIWVLAVSVMLGLWCSRSQTIRQENLRSSARAKTNVKISVNPKIRHRKMYSETNRYVRKLFGRKRDDYVDKNVTSGTLKHRRKHIQQTCSNLEKGHVSTEQIANSLAYYRKVDTVYCPVAKVASKFWIRMLHVVEKGNHKSPFEIADAPSISLENVTLKLPIGDRKAFLQSVTKDSFSFMFARDPYKRIFSSYVDKFMSPNSPYWEYAQIIIYFNRRIKSKCGSDLKFSELIKFLIAKQPATFELHFIPVSIMCDVCNFEYDVIGKVETFKDDVFYILSQIANTKKVYFKDFSQENTIHYILFNARRTFRMREILLECVTHQVIYLRLWRQLQMSGVIDKHLNYPLGLDESKLLNLSSLTNVLLDAYHRSTDARSNSREAYLQAYREVPIEDLEELRLKYLDDFMLFEYESRPSELFNRDVLPRESESFDYFDILNKTS